MNNQTADSKRRTGLFLFLLCFMAYMFSYFGRNTFASCITAMQGSGDLTSGFDSWISAAYLICYGAGQFINGRLVMKIHPKYSMALGLAVSGVVNILMAVVGNEYVMLLLWAVNGYANSLLWPTVIRVFTEWLNRAERKKSGANISPSIPAGMIVCYLICSLSLRVQGDTSWKLAFIIAGGLLILGAAIWFFCINGLKKGICVKITEIREERAASDNAPAAKGKLTFRAFFFFGLGMFALTSFFNGALKEAVVSWTPKFLQESYGFSASSASLVSIATPFVSVLGPYIGIFLNYRVFNNESKTIGTLYAISAVCCTGLFFLQDTGLAALSVILLSVSMACMWGINSQLMTYTTYHFGSLGLSSAVTGTLNAIVFVGSSTFTVLYGNLADSTGSWRIPVLIWAVVGILGALAGFAGARLWAERRPKD